ncbi:MAG: Holliday junction resolvase RuvX [Candidatus Saccharimonadales bacterium]
MPRNNFLGLDVGTRRIGVALARDGVKLAVPLMTIDVDGNEIDALKELITTQQINRIIVGYPRNQSGEATEQSRQVEAFVEAHISSLGVPYSFQDESLTSVVAEAQLDSGRLPYSKADVDAHAAAIILQDYLETL